MTPEFEHLRGAKPLGRILKGGWVSIQTDGPFDVQIRFDPSSPDPKVIGIRVESADATDPATITHESLRALPYRQLRQRAWQVAHFDVSKIAKGPARQRGRRTPDEHYEIVSRVYRRAMDNGKPPLVAVQKHFEAQRSTASKWVQEARRRGLLGWPDGPGLAGTGSSAPLGPKDN